MNMTPCYFTLFHNCSQIQNIHLLMNKLCEAHPDQLKLILTVMPNSNMLHVFCNNTSNYMTLKICNQYMKK